MDIDDMFEQIRTEGAEELRNAISLLIEEAMETQWPAYTKEEKTETKWFLEGLKYALLIVNYTPIRGEDWDGE
jgi:hypothetical protein